ncbi:MAG: homocysteine S-methyltransferase family protein [Candidatus Marinimicrobia bacterium]|nr:homocysteine S-methyltransferase family protein [Candidatus Neomarinimicrobiota bacterium]
MRKPFLEAVRSNKTLVSDGAWGTFLQAEGMQSGDCPEEWNLSHPEMVESIALRYIEAGSDMIETNTFGGSRHKLALYDLGDKTYTLNKIGAELSRKAAGDDHWVIGSIGPSGAMLMMEEVTEEELYEDFLLQVKGLAEGGVDALCIETFSALDEAELVIRAAKTTDLPIICTFTFENGFSMMGVTPEAYAEKMLELGVDVLGTNCGNGLSGMVEIIKAIHAVAPDHPILIHANAGLPILQGTETIYPETPKDMSAFVPEILQAGACIIGGCCGTTPEHIKAIKKAVASHTCPAKL